MATRAHIVLPEELLEAVDRIAGKRKRGKFVEAAVREKLSREVLTLALQDAAGSVALAHYPEWKTPDQVSAWVRNSHKKDATRIERKLTMRIR